MGNLKNKDLTPETTTHTCIAGLVAQFTLARPHRLYDYYSLM